MDLTIDDCFLRRQGGRGFCDIVSIGEPRVQQFDCVDAQNDGAEEAEAEQVVAEERFTNRSYFQTESINSTAVVRGATA